VAYSSFDKLSAALRQSITLVAVVERLSAIMRASPLFVVITILYFILYTSTTGCTLP
jgi:hypothetical protein